MPLVGNIPLIEAAKFGSPLVNPKKKGSSIIAESYRSLRTNLQFFETNTPNQTILITSSGPSEGKTTTVANLGIALAKERRIREGVAAFRSALELDPLDADTHYKLGILLSSQGRSREALSALRQALRIDPNHQAARRALEGMSTLREPL